MKERRTFIMTFNVETAVPIEAIKECIAMTLEQYGDVRCTNIEEITDQQERENKAETK